SHTIILSTHILPEATALCRRVVIINGGRIVAEDSPEQLSARLRRSEKISVTLKTPPADWVEQLRAMSGILSVFPAEHARSALIESELGRDMRDEIARFVVSRNWGLLELRTISMTLEDVFLRLTQHEEGVPAGPAASPSQGKNGSASDITPPA
ncbi:MAG TPA: ABC transporter ATP-binding protein, partial [Nitrospiraceae bacterium]|nr:ABC transporter ATP-binding protein [Nitrospiraceae bacterium]